MAPSAGSAGGGNEPIARNLFAYMFTRKFSSDLADMLPGRRRSTPSRCCRSYGSLRWACKWQSAPTWGFHGVLPDYFGIDQKPAVLRLEDIELGDFSIQYSDDPLTTHVYIEGNLTKIGQNNEALAGWDTAGVATVEDDWLYQRLIKVAPGDLKTPAANRSCAGSGGASAQAGFRHGGQLRAQEVCWPARCSLEKWAQYQTTISMTFMPEPFPGMRVTCQPQPRPSTSPRSPIPATQAGGFSTTAVICARRDPTCLSAMSEVSTPGKRSPTPSTAGRGRHSNNPTGLGSFGTQG